MQNVIAITFPTIFCIMSANCGPEPVQEEATQDGKSAKIPVTGIYISNQYPDGYERTEQDIEYDKNKRVDVENPRASWKLTAHIEPPDATNKQVIWKSEDPTIATIDQDGTVTSIKIGSTTITATTVDGGKTATRRVCVSEGFFEEYYWRFMHRRGRKHEQDE
ncbi:MAG: Ig-like domain-containing protein [Holophagales bacterium]|jgi:transglutaminase/protease-like cytokinesis protein 3|nr:Ig-like domain-containing protein [Holophagales bacterium]